MTAFSGTNYGNTLDNNHISSCISTSKTAVLSNKPFRNMYKYKYIALLDTDEVIIPLAQSNWSEMMSLIKKNLTDAEQIASFAFRNVFYGDWMEEETKDGAGIEIPSYFHLLRHVHRSTTYWNFNLKSFMNTDQAQSQTLKTLMTVLTL